MGFCHNHIEVAAIFRSCCYLNAFMSKTFIEVKFFGALGDHIALWEHISQEVDCELRCKVQVT